MSLSQLVEVDSSLLNDIIIEYVDKLDVDEFDNLEEYVNANLSEIMH
tara:strand:- start:452 stop:592 length:141 start_codon:yes stop_codon:yes gene_type:complete